jgi:hypothetical protein
MNRSAPKIFRPPAEIAKLFANPPLIISEKREDYEALFDAISFAAKPADVIAWLYVRDITDLSWEIKRERNLKSQVLKDHYTEQVGECLRSAHPDMRPELDGKTIDKIENEVNDDMNRWRRDPKAKERIETSLARQGWDVPSIMRQALIDNTEEIDAIDRRIANYELRRMATLRAIENYNEALARRLKAASVDVIEGEFTVAAE